MISPGSFFETIGGFGVENDHYIRDAATFPLAIAVAAWLAASRPSWQAPILTVLAAWYGAHALNHLVDIDDSNDGWVGITDFVSLAGSAAALGWLANRASRRAPQ